ncbi:SGT1-domain-containing protein [Aaosphaeria arxii CBS 175.79]|uniref:SGT1-domain-containing protein n=1 Tax=Aaosphaeria arxii CBS 175.79 TaxID=1450172 RepID=A0A6A5XET7_9PLEO|nr:SGT1-domain-containing protein [Aaosphaeria arxii CBS 175.79]KAF2011618.1 SGT1-domain-containing protein [Aaosphaeria arxii CBS 175.79]
MEDIPKDDFKWFGEGFDGFPKKLPEDVVEYMIYIIDTRLSDVQTRERLQSFQRSLNSLEKKFLKEYIWQREPIKLELVREEGRWLLKGSTNYGDSVADEWLIVWLLRELSKEFKDAWIRIYDTDGEFLLIEAANALPTWLNPEVSENRVWINNHRMLIIPLSKVQNPGPLKLKDSLSIITETPAKPQHFPKVEKEAFHRLKDYPASISENQHHATLPLPRKVAHILHINPSYIAPIVEAFYLRDPIALRLLQPDKSKTSLIFSPEDFVTVSARFTKVLYAQLLGQTWGPPKPWDAALDALVNKNGDAFRDKAELGIKVAAGLEMLIQHSIYADKKPVREIKLLLEDLETGDDSLPSDKDIAQWPVRNDDEGWLDIDFAEFERELAGRGGAPGTGGFGDKHAQDNLRKMVERFNDFMNDEDAGVDGAGGLDPMDVDNDSDEPRGWDDPEDSDSPSEEKGNKNDSDDDDDEEEDDYAEKEFKEYEEALEKFMALSSAEKSALTDDARELARAEEAEQEEDEEIRKLSEMMEAELFSHGALKLDDGIAKADKSAKKILSVSDQKGKGKAKVESVPEGHEDEEDEDGEYLDEDYNLADNMLKAFKGQAGMAGPAGNLMGMMGIQFPPDLDDQTKANNSGRA